jgi:hypothetical protein
MLIAGIILMILGVIFIIMVMASNDLDTRFIIGVLGLIFLFLGTALFFTEIEEKVTTIDCLKGNFPYKQVIQYKYGGNELISQDTIYIKNEK